MITLPLLEGLDGVQKMSKSLGNYVGINEPAREMFGKLMSISDNLMMRYYALLTDITPDALARLKDDLASGAKHPRQVKEDLAKEIVARYHSQAAADHEAQEFIRVLRERELPEEIEEVTLKVPRANLWLPRLMVDSGLAASTSEAQRLSAGAGYRLTGKRSRKPNWNWLPGGLIFCRWANGGLSG